MPEALCLRDTGQSRTLWSIQFYVEPWSEFLCPLVVYCWPVKCWLIPCARDLSSSNLSSIAVIRFIYPFNQYHNLYQIVIVWGYWEKFWKTILKIDFKAVQPFRGLSFLLSTPYSFSSQIFKCLFRIKCHESMSCIRKIINIIDRNVGFLLRCVSPNPTVQSLLSIRLFGDLVSLHLPYLDSIFSRLQIFELHHICICILKLIRQKWVSFRFRCWGSISAYKG